MDIAQEVFKKENLLDFWPSDRQTGKERVEATTRFIVYAMALLFIIRRDGRVVLLGALVLAVLYGLYFNNMIPDGARSVYVSRGVAGLTMPSVENPMGNVLMGEYSSDPNRAPPRIWVRSGKRAFGLPSGSHAPGVSRHCGANGRP